MATDCGTVRLYHLLLRLVWSHTAHPEDRGGDGQNTQQ